METIDELCYATDKSLAEFISAFCDESHQITFGVDGHGGSYFLFPPLYPRDINENTPKSDEEVHELIQKALLKLFDITPEKIERLIDNSLDVEGYG